MAFRDGIERYRWKSWVPENKAMAIPVELRAPLDGRLSSVMLGMATFQKEVNTMSNVEEQEQENETLKEKMFEVCSENEKANIWLRLALKTMKGVLTEFQFRIDDGIGKFGELKMRQLDSSKAAMVIFNMRNKPDEDINVGLTKWALDHCGEIDHCEDGVFKFCVGEEMAGKNVTAAQYVIKKMFGMKAYATDIKRTRYEPREEGRGERVEYTELGVEHIEVTTKGRFDKTMILDNLKPPEDIPTRPDINFSEGFHVRIAGKDFADVLQAIKRFKGAHLFMDVFKEPYGDHVVRLSTASDIQTGDIDLRAGRDCDLLSAPDVRTQSVEEHDRELPDGTSLYNFSYIEQLKPVAKKSETVEIRWVKDKPMEITFKSGIDGLYLRFIVAPRVSRR